MNLIKQENLFPLIVFFAVKGLNGSSTDRRARWFINLTKVMQVDRPFK